MKVHVFFKGAPLLGCREPLLVIALDLFFELCRSTAISKYPIDFNEALEDLINCTYLKATLKGGHFNMVDAETGEVTSANAYAHYKDLMYKLNFYYRADVIATIKALNIENSVVAMRYIDHSAHYLLTEIECLRLLTHDAWNSTHGYASTL